MHFTVLIVEGWRTVNNLYDAADSNDCMDSYEHGWKNPVNWSMTRMLGNQDTDSFFVLFVRMAGTLPIANCVSIIP